MKLRTLDCKNCAAPLRQEGQKLVCRSCGSVFDIPCDATDIEYSRIINAEDYVRLELAKSILALEKGYKTQAQINQEIRDKELKVKGKRTLKIIGLITLFVSLDMIIWYLIEAGVFVFAFKLRDKYHKDQPTETAVWDPGYRVTPGNLKGDKEFWNYINSDIIAETKADYDSRGSVIYSADEIWEVNQDPEIIERCLITTEDSNALYIIFEVTFENDDGRTIEMYYCCSAENIKVNEDGKIVYDGFEERYTSSYDPVFHSEKNLDIIYKTYINSNEPDTQRYVFEF